MSIENLKKIIGNRKLQTRLKDETLLDVLSRFKDEDNISEIITTLKAETSKMVEQIIKEKFNYIEKQLDSKKSIFTPVKGKDYFDGKNGNPPTQAELLSLIKPLIPKPRNGKDGKNGRDGLNGKNGIDGKDGSPDTGIQIAKKLNVLEELVDMKVIRGLRDYLKKLETNLFYKKGGGGGMGLPLHESFEVDSSTTSITLSNNVAANGNAIWCYYNGQFLVKGTHYTVSGKIVTFNVSFTDGTFVDITYIRT